MTKVLTPLFQLNETVSAREPRSCVSLMSVPTIGPITTAQPTISTATITRKMPTPIRQPFLLERVGCGAHACWPQPGWVGGAAPQPGCVGGVGGVAGASQPGYGAAHPGCCPWFGSCGELTAVPL